MPDLKPMPHTPWRVRTFPGGPGYAEKLAYIHPDPSSRDFLWPSQVDSRAEAKHLTDAECAAEFWQARGEWVEAYMGAMDEAEPTDPYRASVDRLADEAQTLYRFAALPHAHEDKS